MEEYETPFAYFITLFSNALVFVQVVWFAMQAVNMRLLNFWAGDDRQG